MNSLCLHCAQSAPNHHLFCDDSTCRTECLPPPLAIGALLGAFEVVQPLAIGPSFTLYEVERARTRLLLKVAHPGAAHAARLEREAVVLKAMDGRRTRPALFPKLVWPYRTPSASPYGRITYGDQLLTYWVAERSPGESLRELLQRQPQPDAVAVGQLLVRLSTALAVLQSRGLVHLALCPEALLVERDLASQLAQLTLIDLGLCVPAAEAAQRWYPALMLPSSAPELLDGRGVAPGYAADVYGLAVLLAELLRGTLAASAHAPLRDDVPPLVALAASAQHPSPAARPAAAAAFARDVTAIVGTPVPPHAARLRLNLAMLAMLGFLSLIFAIALVLTIIAPQVPPKKEVDNAGLLDHRSPAAPSARAAAWVVEDR